MDIPKTIFTPSNVQSQRHVNDSSKHGLDNKNTYNIDFGDEVKQEKTHRIHFQSCVRIRPFLPDDVKDNVLAGHTFNGNKCPSPNRMSVLDVKQAPSEVGGYGLLVLKPKPFNPTNKKNNARVRRSRSASPAPRHKSSGISLTDQKAGNETDLDQHSKNELYPFDIALNTESDQTLVYEKVAKPMVQDLIDPSSKCRHHVLMSFGISNSGKTYTFGTGQNCAKYNSQSPQLQSNKTPRKGRKKLLPENKTPTSKQFLYEDVGHVQGHDGILPRIVHHIFSDAVLSNSSACVFYISIVHIHNDRIFDLLSPAITTSISSTKPNVYPGTSLHNKNSIRVMFNTKTQSFESSPLPTLLPCKSRHTTLRHIDDALNKVQIKKTQLNTNGSSRGHTIITIQLSDGEKKITIIDMAGIERIKKSHVIGSALKESIAINENVAAVFNVLRALKFNANLSNFEAGDSNSNAITNEKENHTPISNKRTSHQNVILEGKTDNTSVKQHRKANDTDQPYQSQTQIVPYRQCALTMLLQPIFSGCDVKQGEKSDNTIQGNTVVTMFLSVYPGLNDYAEKRVLLKQINALRGLSVPAKMTSIAIPAQKFNKKQQYNDFNRKSSISSFTPTSPLQIRQQHQELPQDNTDLSLSSLSEQQYQTGHVTHHTPNTTENDNSNKNEIQQKNGVHYWKRVAKKSPLRKISAAVSANTRRFISMNPPPPHNPQYQADIDSSITNKSLKRQIFQLQEENNILLERNAELEQICFQLKTKNEDLLAKSDRVELCRQAPQKLISPENEVIHHPLLLSPIQHHMDELKRGNDVRKAFMTGGAQKEPFPLEVPDQWDGKDLDEHRIVSHLDNKTTYAVVELTNAYQLKNA